MMLSKTLSGEFTRMMPGTSLPRCQVDALGMTREYECSVYDKRNLLLNKQQLLAIGDRSFPIREKRMEFQHPNVAFHNQPLKLF